MATSILLVSLEYKISTNALNFSKFLETMVSLLLFLVY